MGNGQALDQCRLATMTGDGLGIVEMGAVHCRDERIAYAGPMAGAPAVPIRST